LPLEWINQAKTLVTNNKANLFQIYAAVITNKKDRVESSLKQIDEETDKFNELVSKYKGTKLDPYEVEHLAKLEQILSSYLEKRKICIDYLLRGDTRGAYEYFIAQESIFAAFETELTNLSTYNSDTAKKLAQKAQKDTEFGTMIVIVSILIALAFCTWLGFLTANRIAGILGRLGEKMTSVASGDLTIEKLGRIEKSCIGDLCVVFDTMLSNLYNLVKEVSKSVEEISANSEEMSASSEQTAQGAQQTATSTQQLAQGAQEISRNVELGATSINGLNKTIQGVATEAGIVAKLGNDTETNANVGAEHVKKAVLKIDSIKNVAGAISINIAELGQLSSDIEQIVDLIKNIAGQTNLLALNAAIEAARAGEHGKGFAVVADEVKKLAGQSAGATEKITSMIKEIQNKTHVAVNTMDKATKEVEEGVFVINDAGKA